MARTIDLTTLLSGATVSATEPVITGREADVDRLIALKRRCEQIQAEFLKVRRELEMCAGTLRNQLEEQGKFATVITLQGTTEVVTLNYTNQMKTVDVDEATPVSKSIGRRAFSALFGLARSWVLRPDVDLVALRKLIKAAGVDPAAFIVQQACYRARDGFRKVRFELRRTLTERQNTLLDLLVARLQYEPRIGGVKWADGKGKATNTNGVD
jgi:hypothetical protein